MESKYLKILFVSLFVLIVGCIVYNTQKKDIVLSELAMKNVEALAGGETSTSWTCTGKWGQCHAHCGACGTKVDGHGELIGSHSCDK